LLAASFRKASSGTTSTGPSSCFDDLDEAVHVVGLAHVHEAGNTGRFAFNAMSSFKSAATSARGRRGSM